MGSEKTIEGFKCYEIDGQPVAKEIYEVVMRLNNKVEKLKKALEFYAKPSVWGTDTPYMETSIDPCDQEYLNAYGTRGGKLARQILKEIE